MAREAYEKETLADAAERKAAATEFGRTVVVTAGAGTGKTALLVERTLNVLMLPDRTVPVTDILALTFTNRAAGEMRLRIREALSRFAEWSRAPEGPPESAGHLGSIYRGVLERTGLAPEEVRDRATGALSSLERASISTMHSFAGQILKAHPVEAGVDPRFREDDGLAFAELFRARWERFLETELDDPAPRADLWNAVLDGLALQEITELAERLCDEEVPLETIARRLDDGSLFEFDGKWIEPLAREARELLAAHEDGASQNTGKLLRASADLFDMLRGGALAGKTPDDLAGLEEGLATNPGVTKRWDTEAVARVKALSHIAERLLRCRPEPVRGALDLLIGFARDFRAEFVRSGEMSFGALLVRARDLLRDHHRVREELKSRFSHILVDEFQDTAPVQYEIVFYLAERKGASAREWRDCELEPGKLFIVGDPKQSIYHFRGADIGAYHEVVKRRLAAPTGTGRAASVSLRTNFRSNERVIRAVNGIFERVMHEKDGVQPRYEPLAVRPGGKAGLESQRVDFLLVRPSGGGAFPKADEAHEGEARAVARFIARELVDREDIPNGDGRAKKVSAGDVAILLRKMTNVGCYTEALDAENLPYVVEGEKSFYATQEVTDFLNLLAALSDPHDRTAFVGVLRSGVGALTDADIAKLADAGKLSYVSECDPPDGLPGIPEIPEALEDREGAEKLYAVMRELHSQIARLPVAAAIDAITERLPVVEAAIASGSGERGRANLRKVRRQAQEYGARPEITMREFVSLIKGRVEELREEGESPLAEEDADAVRILTIHKAKGLEFPVVIIPALQLGTSKREKRVWVRSEWNSGEVGLAVGNAWTPAAVRLAAREEELGDAEERRVFYVGATRARERLILSAARLQRRPGGLLSYLAEAVPIPFDSGEPVVIECGGARKVGTSRGPDGAGEVHFTPLDAPEPSAGRAAAERGKPPIFQSRAKRDSWFDSWHERWGNRVDRHKEALERRVFVSPSSLAEGVDERTEEAAERLHEAFEVAGEGPLAGGGTAADVGSVAHTVLELLDFGSPRPEGEVDRLVAAGLGRLGTELRGGHRAIEREVTTILTGFVASEAFAELRRAKLLARELPCILPWEGGVASGRIDLVCEFDGKLLVVDYKTDRVDAAGARERAKGYSAQGEMYARAVTLATGRRVDGFRVLFLRPRVAVDVDIGMSS